MSPSRPDRPVLLTRRSMITAGALLAAQAGLAGLAGCAAAADPVIIAGGPPDAPDLAFSRLLATELGRAGHQATAMITDGNRENRQVVTDSEAHLGICSADTVEADGPLVAIAQLHQRYLHLVVRGDSRVREAGELLGQRVAVPPIGSAGHEAAIRALTAAGAGTATDLGRNWIPMDDGTAARALAGRQLAAMLWTGGLPQADVAAVEVVTELRALDLSRALAVIAPTDGTYQAARLPASVYGQASDVETIAVPTLLICRARLPYGVVSTVVDLLIDSAAALVPATTYGVQYLNRANLIDTAGVGLHPDAVRRYRVRYG